ncbi:MAG: hypothetical protein GX589_10550, partial [Deltaproteobacteria bacterium]|nr:hypothetical protein [Deltaproteobacteria bacterium]
MNGSTRAILGKELKLFARDFGQALQLLLLIGICFIYLYNFQFLREHQDVTEVVMVWWRGLLVLANMCMGSFVITAVCSRFVYPAVSLEGHAYWLLASAPLDFKTFLRAKFRIWLLPVTLIAVVIFVSGAMAIDAPVQILAVTAALSCITAYGLTGLGVGLGALFVDFQWENPAQLSASLGSLLYMLSSIALTGANLLAATLLILACILEDFRSSVPIWICYSLGLSAFIFVLWLNHTVASWAMRNGEQALLRLQKQ